MCSELRVSDYSYLSLRYKVGTDEYVIAIICCSDESAKTVVVYGDS